MNHGSQIVRRGKPVSWYNGRDGALLRHTTYEGYNPIFSVKSPAGSWEVGPYTNDWLYFNLISDSSYSSGSNVPAHQYVFTNDGRLLLNNRSAFRGTVLYNNITGTNGTVYLSESVANFSWLRIFYRDNDWFKASIDVHSPQGTYGDLVITAKSPSGIFWTKHRTVSISGSAISSIRYGCYSVYGTAVGGNGDENTNNIWITAVVGYYM